MKRNLAITALLLLIALTSGCAVGRQSVPAAPMYEPGYEMPIAEEETSPSAIAYSDESGRAYGNDLALANDTERMVVYTADLSLIVPDTEQAIDQIQQLADQMGGYVVSLYTYQYDQGVEGDITLRIPAESFDAALEQLKGFATTVRQESISGSDVTEEYVDLEARLRHLRAKEDQLLEFMDNAETTEDVLAVYEQLSYTQQEIEQVRGRMQYLENQTSLATISVHLTPDALAQPLEVGGWNLPGTVRSAVESLLNALEFIIKATIYLVITILPVIILLAIPVVLLVLFIRWLLRRRKRRRAAS